MSASAFGSPAASLDLTVAGVCLAFHSAGGLRLAPPGFEYPPFLVSRPGRRRIPISVSRDAPRELPTGARLVFDTDDGWQLHARGEERWLRMPRRDAAGTAHAALWQVSWCEPLREACLHVAPQQVHGDALHHVIQYPLDQILLTHALLPDGGLLLHAAGAVLRGAGIALAGVSGAGKSTITRLLRGSSDVTFLSDDRVVAVADAGRHQMHGTPWAGDARVAEPGQAPLKALCFLRQSATPGLVPLEPRAALERLLPVATMPWFDADGIGGALETAERLVSQVPCHELAFSLDAGATRALLEALPDAG